jgi:uncharacterized membrane protein YoaT (DUF817 family)
MNHPLALSLRPALHEVFWVGRQQILACLFGIALLAGMLLTRSWDPGVAMARADFLFLYALGLQLILILFRFEHRREVIVILVFHVLATLMEWFKTSPTIGSWRYPDEGAIFRVYQVPLFAGFLYSSVGSYLARAWRLFHFRFVNYPPVILTMILALLAYVNFFTHHFIFDLRVTLIVASIILFARTRLIFATGRRDRSVPLVAGLVFVALMIWVAENAGTYARAWVYPDQESGWRPVSFHKFWAWYLLMTLSFVLVSLVNLKGPGTGDSPGSVKKGNQRDGLFFAGLRSGIRFVPRCHFTGKQPGQARGTFPASGSSSAM